MSCWSFLLLVATLCKFALLTSGDGTCNLCDGKVACTAVNKTACESRGAHYLPRDTSQQVCRCCASCVEKNDYCPCRGKKCCYTHGYDDCKAKGGNWLSPSFSKKQGCRCCGECKCCEKCKTVKCPAVNEEQCEFRRNGKFIPSDTGCQLECRCCDQCLFRTGLDGDCSNEKMPPGYYKQCKKGLRCRNDTWKCRPEDEC